MSQFLTYLFEEQLSDQLDTSVAIVIDSGSNLWGLREKACI